MIFARYEWERRFTVTFYKSRGIHAADCTADLVKGWRAVMRYLDNNTFYYHYMKGPYKDPSVEG